jgi:hypothetical protein
MPQADIVNALYRAMLESVAAGKEGTLRTAKFVSMTGVLLRRVVLFFYPIQVAATLCFVTDWEVFQDIVSAAIECPAAYATIPLDVACAVFWQDSLLQARADGSVSGKSTCLGRLIAAAGRPSAIGKFMCASAKRLSEKERGAPSTLSFFGVLALLLLCNAKIASACYSSMSQWSRKTCMHGDSVGLIHMVDHMISSLRNFEHVLRGARSANAMAKALDYLLKQREALR